jgi:outer membrane protein assembly factor BamB
MFWAVVMIWAAHVHAQDADVPAGPDRRAADSVEAGVYLDDSLEAADQLTRALRLAETEQWPEAVTVMQQVTANFARNLVQLEPGLYVNVAEYVNRQIAGWPEAGLEAYRARAQAGAKSAVDSALAAQPGDQSIEQLIDVVERYYCTTHAVRAADAAAQLSMEAGRFALASDLYARLLRRHPDREQWAMPIKAKLALSQAWAGRAEQARQLVAEITKANPEFKVTWRSTELPIAEAIEHELAALADTMLETQADEADFVWPTYGGGAGRNRPIASQAQAGAPLWRIEGVGGLTDGIGSGAGAHEMEQGRYLALQPTTAGGIIYLHNDDTVHAVWASNGEPAWAPFRARGLSGTSRRFSRGQQPPPLYTTTLGGRRLYIRLGGGPLSSRSRSRDRESILVCLDARTGRRIWRVDRQRLGPWFEKTYFDSSPTYHDGKLYVIARNRRSLGFEDCYLLCFSAETGEVEWKTHLASGATGGFGQLRPTLGYLAIAGHAAYVCTHLGAIVSVSLHNGQVRWARIYADAPNDGTRLFDAPYRQRNGPWQYDPVMVWRDRIVCKPLDTDRLLTLDQADGAIVADTKLDRLHDLEYIAGILDDRLYGVGEQVFCWNLLDNQEVWARDLPPDGAIYGRGCLTTTHLFVPTQGGLHRYPVDETDADGRAWDGKKEGGNILVTPTQILVAGNDHLSAYARKDQALARLRDRITEAPDNPAGYLDLSELAFRVAEYDDGIAALESAADRAGGFTQITEAAIKRRVFRNCLHFADVLLTLEPPRRDDALTLYGRAGQCAPDTAGHVAFRRRIAAFHAIAGDYARAIEYWQQILTDRSLRQVGVSIDEGKEITAGELAESTIDRLMRTHGREVYAPFEDRARALLAAGRTTGQTHLLARVSDVFPNSRSAAPALIAQGDLLGRDDRFLDAARLYRRALTRYRDQIDAPALMRRLSDSYRAAGQRVTAAAWLAKAAREFPQARVTVDMTRLTWAQYQQRVLAGTRYAEPPRPVVTLPIRAPTPRTFDSPVEIIEPARGDLMTTRWDFLAVYVGQQLLLLDPTDGSTRFEPIDCPMKPALLGTTAEAAVFATDFQIFGVSLASGEVTWRRGEYPTNLADFLRDPEGVKQKSFATALLLPDRVIAARSQGAVVCYAPATGEPCWSRPHKLPPTVTGPVVGSEELIVCRGVDGKTHRFFVLDAASGKLLQTLELDEDEPSVWFDLSPDGTLVIATAQSLQAFEPFSGKPLWTERPGRSAVTASLALGLDGVYLSQDGQRLTKRDLSDGRVLWTSPVIDPPSARPQTTLSTVLHRGDLFVLSSRAMITLDPDNGTLAWEGTTERDARLSYHLVAEDYATAIDARREQQNGRGKRTRHLTAYFYDRRDRSGILPDDHGIAKLGSFDDLKHITLRNHALIVQDGQTLHCFGDKTVQPAQ